jgi:hypothetical protein
MSNKSLLGVAFVLCAGVGLWLALRNAPSVSERTTPAVALAVPAKDTQQELSHVQPSPAPAVVVSEPSVWQGIWGDRWDEIRRKNLENGLDLESRKPPLPWEEAKGLLVTQLTKFSTEETQSELFALTGFSGVLDRKWAEQNLLDEYEIIEEAKLDLLAIEEKHQATLRPLAEQWIYAAESRLLSAWASRDIERAPYNLNYGGVDPYTPKQGAFLGRSFCAGGWCARVQLSDSECPEIVELENQLANLRGKKVSELSSYARKKLSKKN